MPNVAIIGGGISGIAAAHYLVEKGCTVKIFEAQPRLGGMCQDVVRDGINVHTYGPHIFHTNNEHAYQFVKRFANKIYRYEHKVQNPQGKPIPFNMDSCESERQYHLMCLAKDEFDSGECTLDELAALSPEHKELAEFIFDKYYRFYSAKQWGEMPSKSTLNRVKIRLNTDARYFRDKYQFMPDSYTSMFNNVVADAGGKITFETSRMVEYKDLRMFSEKFDYVICTGRVDRFMGYKFGELPYLTEKIFDVRVNQKRHQNVAVVNYTDSHAYTRVTEYKHFMEHADKLMNVPKTVIQFEFPLQCFRHNMPMYPIVNSETMSLHEKYKNALQKEIPNILFLGRIGNYEYINMDQAIYKARELVYDRF